jgi:CheY-like chemotaxis protein
MDGGIVSANDAATRLLRGATGKDVESLADVFDPGMLEAIMSSRHRWTEVNAPGGKRWSVRVRPWEDGRLMVILAPGQDELKRRSLVRLLLDIHVAAGTRWPYAHRVLVVDDSRVARETSTRMLERAGCVVYGAADQTLAVRLMRADHGIGVVLLDYEMPDDANAVAAELAAVRPHVRIVGISGRDHRADFEKMGVSRYIQKPWTIEDLIDAVRDPETG